MTLAELLVAHGNPISAEERRRFNALYASFSRMVRAMEKTHETFFATENSDDLDAYPEFNIWVGKTGLQEIGSGSFRLVLDLGDGRVLKLEQGMGKKESDGIYSWNGKPSGCSLAEARRWMEATPHQRAKLVPVLGHDPQGRWVVMPKVSGLPDALRSRIPDSTLRVATQLGLDPYEVCPRNLDATFRLLDYGT